MPGEDSIVESPDAHLSWTVLGLTAAKPVNDCFKTDTRLVWRSNEDRFRFSETGGRLLAAVADGAGSSGMFCGAWAEELVERLPEDPITGLDGLNRWMDGFWEDFADAHKRNTSTDPARLGKLVREGSCATLVTCWLEKRDKCLTMRWLCYGDSPLYVFDHSGDQISLARCCPPTLGELERDPHLLNWKDLPKEPCLRTGTINLHGRTTVLLASDGIGQFILLRYLASLHDRHDADTAKVANGLLGEFRQMVRTGNSGLAETARRHLDTPVEDFVSELDDLKSSLQSEQAFIGMIKNRHDEGLMPNDDATLVMINITGGDNVDKKESSDMSCSGGEEEEI